MVPSTISYFLSVLVSLFQRINKPTKGLGHAIDWIFVAMHGYRLGLNKGHGRFRFCSFRKFCLKVFMRKMRTSHMVYSVLSGYLIKRHLLLIGHLIRHMCIF